jgi:hypothetical protein
MLRLCQLSIAAASRLSAAPDRWSRGNAAGQRVFTAQTSSRTPCYSIGARVHKAADLTLGDYVYLMRPEDNWLKYIEIECNSLSLAPAISEF